MEKEVRLINADKLKQHYAWWENGTAEMTLAEAKKNFDVIIDVQPTVDAEPVRHGRWINHFDDLFPEESTQECSVCHAEQMGTMLNDNYCPNCGAKMDEVEDGK